MTPEDFWGMMTKTENCWVWNGRKNPAGYGTLEFNKKTMLAHRLAWKLTNGEIPTKMQVCHHCDNPPCCNPKHLFLGTDQDNRTDMVNKGRSLYGARQPISKLTDDQTLEIRRLYRETDLLYKDIAKMFGISKSHVGHICLRKSWKHLP